MSSSSLPVLDATALSVELARPGVLVIDFTARGCAPCAALAPVLVDLARELAGAVRMVAIDVGDQPLVAERFLVRAMPTLVLVRDGREVGRAVGNRPRRFIAGMLARALGGEHAITSP
ncbi:MAG: thioredoxin family protein [Kofleriaceae bacterium]|nr:thioredoxin family protein [Kofleriaceae bacterium]